MCVQKAVAALMTTDDPNTNMKILCATRDQKRKCLQRAPHRKNSRWAYYRELFDDRRNLKLIAFCCYDEEESRSTILSIRYIYRFT